MSDIFISYAREDRLHAGQIARGFEARGWSVFLDRNIPSGKTWRSFVGKALEEARCVVVLWSASSIESHRVHEEADDGRQRNILVPVLLEQVPPPIGFRSIQAANLVGWDGMDTARAFAGLAADVEAMLTPAREPSPSKARSAEKWQTGDLGEPTLVLRVQLRNGEAVGYALNCYFINLTNVSPVTAVDVIHVWYEDEKHNFPVRPQTLPVHIEPGHSWETWIEIVSIPTRHLGDAFHRFRARISTGRTFTSQQCVDVP